jgi:hypothetical protein
MDQLLANKKVQIVLIALGVLFLGFVIFSSFIGRDSKIDSFPYEGSSSDYSELARIVDGEDLFRALGGDRRYDSFARDLRVFGQTAYSAYKEDASRVVGFRVDKINQDGQKVSFTGRYGSSSNKIKVELEKLQNDRISTKIEDTKTKLSINDSLPSNTQLNKYISSLPKTYSTFSVEYVRSGDIAQIYINEKNPALVDPAFEEVKKEITDGSFDQSKFTLIFPTESSGL